jgi:tRNA threonylcarbamoyladenosine biosynthesis protein TsaB
LLLSIDTAGSACAVALTDPDGETVHRILSEPRLHSSMLVPLIDEIVRDAEHVMTDLRAVAVSKGPGSFTGLRIGVSTAKGLAFGLNLPIVGVPTFEALVHANRHLADEGDVVATSSPSRRNEVYIQTFRITSGLPEAISAPVSARHSELENFVAGIHQTIMVIGEGAASVSDVLSGSNLVVTRPPVDAVKPVILGIAELGLRRLAEHDVEDLAMFEPFYLKDFVAKIGGSPFDRLKF